MYIYKRLRISKSAVTILVIVLALAVWGVLGLMGTLLAHYTGEPHHGKAFGKKASFEVELNLEDSDGNPVVFNDSTSGSGTAPWPNLSPSFGGYDDFIKVGVVVVDGVLVDVIADTIGIALNIKNRDIVEAQVFFRDDEGIGYKGETDIVGQQTPSLPDVGGSFTVQIGKPVDVWKSVGKRGGEGKKERFLGTVYLGDAIYTRTQ